MKIRMQCAKLKCWLATHKAKAKALGLRLVQTSASKGNQVPELFGGLASDILRLRG